MDNELKHFGVPGMKWGQRKQPERVGGIGRSGSKKTSLRKQRVANYKLVKSRLKKAGIDSMKLQNYERGGISDKKVKKYLGKDVKVSQVSDYIKTRNKRANVGMIIGGIAGTSLAVLLNRKGII